MRIVQALGWYFPDSLGGTEVYVAALARRLSAAGHEVFIAAPDPESTAPRTYLHAGIPVFRYPIPARPSRDEVQGRRPTRGAELFHRYLAELRPDVAHLHTFVTGLGEHELEAARAAGARTVVTTHSSSLGFVCQRGTLLRWGEEVCDGVRRTGLCAACALVNRGLPRPPARLLGAVPPALGRLLRHLPGAAGTALGMSELIAHNRRREEGMSASLDRFVVLTGAARDILLANGFPPDRLTVNRLGLDRQDAYRRAARQQIRAREGRASGSRPLTAGFLGRFESVKGAEVLARAAAALPPEVSLRIELRGPAHGAEQEARLARLRDIASRHDRLTVGGPVPAEEVPELLAGWDLLVCPSLCAEGGPTVAIEAQAAGVPVVGSRLGGLAELIDDGVNGRLVPPGDPEALAAVLREAAENPALLERWRENLPPARTMDEVAADYLALYEGLAREAAA